MNNSACIWIVLLQHLVSSYRVTSWMSGIMKVPTFLHKEHCWDHWGNGGKWNMYQNILLSLYFKMWTSGYRIRQAAILKNGKKATNWRMLFMSQYSYVSITIVASFTFRLCLCLHILYSTWILKNNCINISITTYNSNNYYQRLIAYLVLSTRWH